MTVLEAGAKLYQWFSENDSFSMEEDFIKIVMVTDHPSRDRAALNLALQDLKSLEIVRDSEVDEKTYWVLKRSFTSYEQSLTISADVAITISLMINKFCEIVDNSTEECDALNLKESDLKNLLYITNLFMNKELDTDSEQ